VDVSDYVEENRTSFRKVAVLVCMYAGGSMFPIILKL
jgi:hypothetical protein